MMKTHFAKLEAASIRWIAALAVAVVLCGCERNGRTSKPAQHNPSRSVIDPLAVVLAPHSGDQRIDTEIRERQARIRASIGLEANIERLGWLFVAKARESFDAGFYSLAEQCALALDARKPGSAEALLLRGHAFQSQHRFHEAEVLARELIQKRGLAFDHGLLGDILVDSGRVDDAAREYQAMLDLKPDPQGYARAAHIRWLKGNLDGAIELTRMAARGATPRDPEAAAWMHTQLARYLWQSRAWDEAAYALHIALEFQKAYAPALLLRGRMLLAENELHEAVSSLRDAASANPLPEYQWALSEALRAGGRDDEARAVEAELVRSGASADPRNCALFLATRGERVETALALAQKELAERGDVFTYDTLAWALASAGRIDEAQANMARALALRTEDARLFFHAAVIAARGGKADEAVRWLEKANSLKALLLPSERAQLQSTSALLTRPGLSRIPAVSTATRESFPIAAVEFPTTEP